tara:strand:- start:2060 stop:2548 length:489 start_codon:yes stop_codon:yes gene_type:complete
MFIKYTGKWNELKPSGWTFQKLFARNYISYRKEFDDGEFTLWIWKHLGGYVEIEDLFSSKTAYLIQAILNDTLTPSERGNYEVMFFNDYKNKDTYARIAPDAVEPDYFDYNTDIKEGLTAYGKAYKQFCKDYSRFRFDDELVKVVKEMHSQGFFEVCEGELK